MITISELPKIAIFKNVSNHRTNQLAKLKRNEKMSSVCNENFYLPTQLTNEILKLLVISI